MTRGTLVIVGADKGGVGKTTICRTLLDFVGAHQLPARAFDTEYPKGNLRRFHPDQTQVVDMTSVSDQMRILDTLEAAKGTTVIDVRAGLLSYTLELFDRIGVLDAVRQKQLRLVLLHIVGPSVASLDEVSSLAPYAALTRYCVVKNHTNEAGFFGWNEQATKHYFNGIKGDQITIPKLNEMAIEQVDLASVPFTTFVANQRADRQPANYSFVLRGYVRHWLGQVWSEFERIKLGEHLMTSGTAPSSSAAFGDESPPSAQAALQRAAQAPMQVSA